MTSAASSEAITVVGETNFRNKRRQFGIKTDDRRRHFYVIGKTGVGKTTLLANMIIQDIQAGRGIAVVDPHGDLAEEMRDFIPHERINDVVYFDPSDGEFPIAFNVLETVDPSDPKFVQEKNLVSSGLIGVFKKIWADSWGPRLEYILRNTILALLDNPGNTLLGIPRMYVDKAFRKRIVDGIQDPVVKAFWVDEFANYNDKFRAEAISPIQNKVGQFLSSSIIRNVVGQPKSTIDIADIMDNGKILLMNLSKGKIGEDNSSLIGAMMITKIQLAAMDRAKISEEQRKDFYLYVDEFQNFATESFAAILSEARKYRLNLILAHQYITQMAEEVRDAVFGNLGTIASFRVGAFDAEFLEPEFLPVFNQTDMVNLDNHHAYIKLMIDGVTSKPFSMNTLPVSGVRYENKEKVVRVSRERFGRPREIVEDKIARWSGVMFRGQAEEENVGPEERRDRPLRPRREEPPLANVRELPSSRELEDVVVAPEAPTNIIRNLEAILTKAEEPKRLKRSYPTTCDRCGKATEVPFEPTPGKPKYCKDCLQIIRAEKRRTSIETVSEPSAESGRPVTRSRSATSPPPPVRRAPRESP
jgi:CxxC-x17-CxxC domain-containing protein